MGAVDAWKVEVDGWQRSRRRERSVDWLPKAPCEKERVVGDKSGEGTPGPISNPAVKLTSAHGSLGFPHARVGHCQLTLPFSTLSPCIGRDALLLSWHL